MINSFKIGIFKKMLSSRLGKVLFEGKEQPGVVYIPYGMFANIQENIASGVLPDQGNEESLLFIPFDIENRDESLEGKEIGFGIPSEKNRIYFRKGKITFKIDDIEGGDFAVRFNELESKINELNNLLNNHVHDGVIVSVSGGSGAPAVGTPGSSNPPTTDLSIDISDAKIDKIELPEL